MQHPSHPNEKDPNLIYFSVAQEVRDALEGVVFAETLPACMT